MATPAVRKTSRLIEAPPAERRLRDLSGVGKSVEADLHKLGIRTVESLASADADHLYQKLGQFTGQRQDPCVLDTFRCAVAQARNPDLPEAQRQWWWWSQQRKAQAGRRA